MKAIVLTTHTVRSGARLMDAGFDLNRTPAVWAVEESQKVELCFQDGTKAVVPVAGTELHPGEVVEVEVKKVQGVTVRV